MKKIYIFLYSLFLVNYLGLKIKFKKNPSDKYIRQQRLILTHSIFKKLNIEILIEQLEYIKNIDSKIILISNHRSIIDPLIVEYIVAHSKIPLGIWVAKNELYSSPFFGIFVRNSGTILVNREKKDTIRFLKDVSEEIKNEHSIFIFPEGTRNKTDKNLLAFQGGLNIIAKKNKTDILPIYIKNRADNILKNSIASNKKQIIEVEIGKIIPNNTKNIEEAYSSMFNI